MVLRHLSSMDNWINCRPIVAPVRIQRCKCGWSRSNRGCTPDDAAKPRTETRYVVADGAATLIGRTSTRYTRLIRNGYAAVKTETWRATNHLPLTTNHSNAAYSYEIFYADTGDETPLLMRNAVAESLDEDGILTVNAYALTNGLLVCESRRYAPSTLPNIRDHRAGRLLRHTPPHHRPPHGRRHYLLLRTSSRSTMTKTDFAPPPILTVPQSPTPTPAAVSSGSATRKGARSFAPPRPVLTISTTQWRKFGSAISRRTASTA